MKLSTNMIYECLHFEHMKLWYTAGNNRIIEDVMFITDSVPCFTTNHLYVGPVEVLPPIQDIPDNASFLCFGKSDIDLGPNPRFNLILIQDWVDIFDLFNLLQEIVTNYILWQESLERAIQQDAPLQEFVDFSTAIVGYPICVINIAQGSFSVSNFANTDDIIWDELQNGTIRTELSTWDSTLRNHVTSKEGSNQVYSNIAGYTLLSQAIRVFHHTVGFVSIFRPESEGRRFSRCAEQLVNYLTVAISKRMSNNEIYQYSRGFILDTLIADLLDRKITDRKTINERLEFANWKCANRSRLYVIKSKYSDAEHSGIHPILDQIENILPHAKALYYHGEIIVLQQMANDDIYAKKTDPRFTNWLQSHNTYCGISNRFTDYMELAEYYNQASKAIRFGCVLHPNETFHLYQDYIQEHMYEILSSHTDLRLFIHPVVSKLMKYNKSKDYIYDTINRFVKNDFNIINTAKEMYIHKNTLSYRLHQIEELTEFSFSDPEARAIVSNSVSILSYMITFLHYNINKDVYESPQEAEE